MTPTFAYPPKPIPGDAVAVLSPSGRSAARFPAPLELGLRRLRDELGLVPVEYPTTRAAQASPAERAGDIQAAFADSEIRAVIASIGGEDELKVLAQLDLDVLAGNPKPFFGYSDNTNLHLFLWSLGIVSYHGGAVMVQLGRPGSMHPLTLESLSRALFTHGTYELTPAEEWGRPKAWSHEQRNSLLERARYLEAQREAVLTAVAEYCPAAHRRLRRRARAHRSAVRDPERRPGHGRFDPPPDRSDVLRQQSTSWPLATPGRAGAKDCWSTLGMSPTRRRRAWRKIGVSHRHRGERNAPMPHRNLKELAHRRQNGLGVTLLWDAGSNSVSVEVGSPTVGLA